MPTFKHGKDAVVLLDHLQQMLQKLLLFQLPQKLMLQD
jgi:hypothetical protein